MMIAFLCKKKAFYHDFIPLLGLKKPLWMSNFSLKLQEWQGAIRQFEAYFENAASEEARIPQQ